MKSPLDRGFTLVELMVVVVVLGLLAAVAIPNYARLQDHAKSARVMSNCHTLQISAEDFAVRNDGVYASTTVEALPTGETLVDLLPGGRRLTNPWTGLADLPVEGPAGQKGETGYQGVQAGGISVGYIIDGFGNGVTVLTLSNGR